MGTKKFVRPTPQEVEEYARTVDYPTLDGEAFCDHYASKGYMIGKSPMKDWKACVRTWKRMDNKRHGQSTQPARVEGKTMKERYLNEDEG